jgi:hypothetical protein
MQNKHDIKMQRKVHAIENYGMCLLELIVLYIAVLNLALEGGGRQTNFLCVSHANGALNQKSFIFIL